jgi:predicted dehydrogenase
MDKLRVGVIGLGMGKGHIRGYQNHEAASVVAIADLDKEKLQEVGKQFEIPNRYTSGDELIEGEDLDVVSIATPNKLHKPLTIKALEAGCHVLCEKPMAMNAEEAEDMVAAARENDRRLMINFSFRFNETSDALKKRIEAGELGEIYYGRTLWLRRRGLPGFGGWFGKKQLSGGGPLIDLGVHRLDLALWMMGYPKPLWVMGSTYDHIGTRIAKEEKKDFDVEDMAVAMIKFDNGATLELEAAWACHIKEKELMETRLLGTDGGLLYSNCEEGYRFKGEIFCEKDGYHFDSTMHPGTDAFPTAMEYFADCILNDRPHMATGEEGVIVMELLDAIYKSAEKGEPVRIES